MIAFISSRDGPTNIYLTNTDGSIVAPLVENATNPSWSPDGTRIAFNKDGYVHTSKIDGSDFVRLAEGGVPKWSPAGQLITFYRSGHIYVMNADGSNQRRVSDEPIGADRALWSPDGTRLVISKDNDGTVVVFDLDTSQLITKAPLGGPLSTWAPDSKWLAYAAGPSGDLDVYKVRPDGTERIRLTTGAELIGLGVWWSPDGRRIAYISRKDVAQPGNVALFIMLSDGSGQTRLAQASDVQHVSWSPDGSRIAYSSRQGTRLGEIYVVDINSGNEFNLTDNPEQDSYPQWQPALALRNVPSATPTPIPTLIPTEVPTSTPSPTPTLTPVSVPVREVSGIIAVDTTWRPNYEYLVIGTVGVEIGTTLKIDPGTVVKFSNAKLQVAGTLRATGTAEDRVIFSSDSRWSGIEILNSSRNSVISYAIIERADDTAVDIGGELSLTNTIVRDSNWGVWVRSPRAIISENEILSNEIGLLTGVISDTSASFNTIQNNGIGISILASNAATHSFTNNNIFGNTEFNIRVWGNGGNNVVATNNWWGTVNNAAIENGINHRHDDLSLPNVLYEPFAFNLVPQAP